jgi:hypothetical protein
VLRVTGLRACVGAAPSGECELHRTCVAGSMVRGMKDVCGMRREDSRSVLTRARDIMVVPVMLQLGQGNFSACKKCTAAKRGNRDEG